jgi:DNA-binding Lrp family transcriptional regulator
LLDALQRDASRSNLALAELVHISPPTCLRRVKRLVDAGWIERQVAHLAVDRISAAFGHGLTALVEVTLDAQGAEHMDAFEALRASAEDAGSAMLARISRPGLCVGDPGARYAGLPGHHPAPAHPERQCAQREGVFRTKRAKFSTTVPLGL